MILEQYVSFETAKLLNEKGFNEPCYFYYDEDGECDYPYKRPTQALVMRWLREIYNIYIMIEHNKLLTPHFYFKLDDYISTKLYMNYEEACEAAIQYCLEKLMSKCSN